MRRSVSDHPCLDIAELKRRQLFEGGQTTPVKVRVDAGEFLVQHRGHGQELEVQFRSDHGSGTENVKWTKVKLNLGLRPFFCCSRSDARALKLFVADGQLASASELGLTYPSRVAVRKIATVDRWQDLRLPAEDPNSTEFGSATSCFSAVSSAEFEHSVKQHDCDGYRYPERIEEVCGQIYHRKCPQINTFALEDIGAFDHGPLSSSYLKYLEDPLRRKYVKISMMFDLSHWDVDCMRYVIAGAGGQTHFGKIKMIRSGEHWQFICPVRNAPTYTLCLRDHMLGSPQGLGVRNSAVGSGRR